MFFITYLRRELRRRMRQATFIALGLAVGIGLVVTVTAASAGVKKAQSDVLKSLWGRHRCHRHRQAAQGVHPRQRAA